MTRGAASAGGDMAVWHTEIAFIGLSENEEIGMANQVARTRDHQAPARAVGILASKHPVRVGL
jgi:hypothetical protein